MDGPQGFEMSKICLTEAQKETYTFITRYYKKNGVLPSLAEIADDAGCTVPGVAYRVAASFLKGAFGHEVRNTRHVITESAWYSSEFRTKEEYDADQEQKRVERERLESERIAKQNEKNAVLAKAFISLLADPDVSKLIGEISNNADN